VDEAVKTKQAYETTQIKTIFHGHEGQADMNRAVERTEAERAPLAAAIAAAVVPVKHTLRIVPVAMRQWQGLRGWLDDAGARISTMSPVAGLPDLVFTANAALIHRNMAVLARFRHPQRAGEEPHDATWLSEHGFEVVHAPGDVFEGAATRCSAAIPVRGLSHSQRRKGHQRSPPQGCRVIPLELVDPYYYNGHVLLPARAEVAIYHPPA
jgi:hypothetical protein